MAANDLAQLRRWTQQHDAEAFEDLVRQYAGMVFGAARRILRNDAEAEEIAQECFLKLAQADTGVSANVPGWLHRTATNLSLNRYKENKRRAARDTAYADEHGAVSPAAAWSDVEPLVDAAIDELPEDLRRLVVRHFLEGAPYRELAGEFGITRAQVIYRIRRGVQQVRAILKSKGVKVSAGALAAMIAEHFSGEASAALIGTLGKLALAGPAAAGPDALVPVAHTVAAAASSIAFLKPLAVAVLILAVAGGGWYATRPALHGTPPHLLVAPVPKVETQSIPSALALATSNTAAVGALAQVPRAPASKASTETGPGEIRGTAYFDPIGRSTYNPPLPADAYITVKRITWTPYGLAPDDTFVQVAGVGEDNFFRFERLPLGVYAVRLIADGRTAVNFIALTPEEPRKHLTVGPAYRLAPTAGIVRDETGAPLPGVNIMIARYADPQATATNEWQVLAASQTITGADGGFLLEFTGIGDRAPARYAVLARKDGYAPFVSPWFQGGETGLEFRMTRGTALSGRLTDRATGVPAPQQHLTVASDIKWDRREFTTDEKGDYHIEHLGPYHYFIQTADSAKIVSLETGYVDLAKESSPAERDLELVPGGTITGRIYDRDTQLGYLGVPVYLHDPGTTPRLEFYTGYNIRQTGRTTTTDADGRYTFEGLPGGKYSVERENVSKHSKIEGQQSTKRSQLTLVNTEGGPARVDFEIVRGKTASGRVVDTNGQPVDDAVVMAYDPVSGLPEAVMYSPEQMNWTYTDSLGRFTISGLEVGKKYWFAAERDKPFLVPNGLAAEPAGPIEMQDDVSNVSIAMRPEARILATVVDRSGRPMLNARVHADSGRRTVHFRATGPDGRVAVDKLTAGTYDLFVDAPTMGGPRVGPLHRIKVVAGDRADGGRLVYSPPSGVEFTGRVTDTSGRPISGAQINIFNGRAYARSGDDGVFRVFGLAKGTYYGQATHPNYSPFKFNEWKVPAPPLQIQMHGRGTVTGEVYHDGLPVKDFSVVYMEGDSIKSHTSSPLIDVRVTSPGMPAQDGRFTYERVAEGDATFVVFANGLAPAFQVVHGIHENQSYNCPPFYLTSGAMIEGTVLDSEGKPAAGCGIAIGENWRNALPPANSQGQFWIKGLPAGEFRVWLIYRDLPRQSQHVTVRPGAKSVQTFRLNGGNSISGHVYLRGSPVTNAAVLGYLPDMTSSFIPMPERNGVRTDANGAFLIKGIEDGVASLAAVVNDGATTRQISQAVPVANGMDHVVEIRVGNGSAGISGHILDSSGAPVEGQVSVRSASGAVNEAASTKTGRDGSYELNGLPARVAEIQLYAAGPGGGQASTQSIRLNENQTLVHDFRFPPQSVR